VNGTRHGYLYALVDTGTGKTAGIGEAYEGLGRPLEVKRVVYPAADGLRIAALLTLPAGRSAAKLPLVVLPHGGPATADVGYFDWWSQAIAAQGYAVLQPDYRGSDLGWTFMSAGFGQWGRKMQTDLSDGVRYLAKEGVVDPARVCIVGGSYGGYAALAGVTLDAGVYRCAVSVAGISDLSRFLKWNNARTALSGRESERFWDRYMGAKGVDDPVLATISPLKHIDAANVPVLLIHGRDDTVVPFEQSQIMYDALKAAGKPVQLVDLKQEDHWLSRGETRLQMLQSTVAFLRANNPPD
jgi:dipeptidyl aminopeptidase/acylaminoacyl peptidase